MGTGTKYSDDRPLANDETRLRPYDKLSRGTKQEMDLSRRAVLEKAKKDADTSDIPQTMMDLLNNESAATLKENMRKRQAARSDAVRAAQDSADYKDIKRGNLYGDNTPAKLADVAEDTRFAKGGRVTGFKGYGAAKKV